MNNEYHFYDTSALLERANTLSEFEENIVISTTVLEELEKIKSSNNKDEVVKQMARKIIRYIKNNPSEIEVICYVDDMLDYVRELGIESSTPDNKILAAAIWYDQHVAPDNTTFFTNDLSLSVIANLYFGEDSIFSIENSSDYYKGYVTVNLNEEELSNLYQYPNIPLLEHYTNEYVFVENIDGELVDILCWTGEHYRPLTYKTFSSKMFGTIKPMKDDKYQRCAFDSLANNQMTLLKGPAGTGKSIIALSYLFYQLEEGQIDKIIVFCNTVATKNSAKLGYYPGNRDDKLLDSQIGNFLASKLGGKIEVERLMKEETLILLPLSDIRGFDTSGMNAGIYITEAQNMDISLMKLALQRIGEDSIVIIDGDCEAQVDLQAFSGANNGMKRASEVFRGENFYGEVELGKIHRGRIAITAQKM